MKLDFEEYIIDIVESCSYRLNGALRVGTTRPIESPSFKERVADATKAFLVDGTSRENGYVLIVSNPRFPDFVNQAVSRAFDAQSVLGSSLGRAVCTPLLTGAWGGQSYAVYKRLDGYSRNKYLRRIQILSSSERIFAWLSGVFDRTKTEYKGAMDQERDFFNPLRILSADKSLDDIVQKAAFALESRISRGEARTFSCLQHGDFWFGNILFYRSAASSLSPIRQKFQVIDWGGSRLNGYPGIDALRFSLSAFGQGRVASERFCSYCDIIGLSKVELSLSCVCSLGWLEANLNQFPKSRFNELASNVVRFLDRHEFLDAQ
ncbi:MAG: hypothetical protein Q8L53_16290 [Aestuariivirga sp.]|nr:hypothetical protein [Aestuariivirga sp.]